MRNIIHYLVVIFFVTVHTAKAQEPTAKNGKFVTVKGLKLYYEESGKGRSLLLLHNFFSSSSHWQPFITEFSKHYRVIALDLPGHSRSNYMDTTNIYLHKKAAEYIIALLDTLEVDSVNIIGASSGGMIALYMATLRPELIKKMVVVGGQVYYTVQNRQFISAFGQAAGISERLGASRKTHGETKGALLEKQFWNFRDLYGDPSFTSDILATVKAETLIVHGDNDKIAPVSNALEMYQAIPNAHLWIVPNGGHLPHLIPENVRDFLRRTQSFMSENWK